MEQLRGSDPREIGPYRLVARVGEGGMGQVYLGLSAGGRQVAVKVMRAGYAADPAFRRRFRREVESAMRVGGHYTALVVDLSWATFDLRAFAQAADLLVCRSSSPKLRISLSQS